MSTSINNTIACNEPHASLDVYYGPYDSVAAALEALKDVTIAGVTYHKKHVGLTVGVWENSNTIKEYWFQGGTSADNLVEKTNGGGGLPENIKLVTFDKNRATGTQNSILTDNDSKVCLPEPTITRSGFTFAGWLYGSSTYEPGATVTIGTDTTIQAQWSSTTRTYVVNWTIGTGISSISGKYNLNNDIIPGITQLNAGDIIVLTATLQSGYEFTTWEGSGIPSGTTLTNSILSFQLGASNVNVTARATAIQQGFVVRWDDNVEHVNQITGVATTPQHFSTDIENGVTLIPAGNTVVLTAVLEDGWYINEWTNKPTGAQQSGSQLTFEIQENTDVITPVVAQQVYSIIWDEAGRHSENIQGIKGALNDGTILHSGGTATFGQIVVLQAVPVDGYVFKTFVWRNAPSGIDLTQPEIEIPVRDNISGITAKAVLSSDRCLVNTTCGEGISNIKSMDMTTGEPINNNQIKRGNTIKIEAIVMEDFMFKQWRGSGIPEGVDVNVNVLTFTVENDIDITAYGMIETTTVTYSAGTGTSGVECVDISDGSTTVESGTAIPTNHTIQLTATETSGYGFSHWTGLPNGVSSDTNPTPEFVVGNNNLNIQSFGVPLYTVNWGGTNVTITGKAGSDDINKGAAVKSGSTITLTATAAEGYVFDKWQDCPSGVDIHSPQISFTLTDNVSITAIVIPTYQISWRGSNVAISGVADGKTITSGSNIKQGRNVVLTATYNPTNYQFNGWSGTPTCCTVNKNELSFTVNENCTAINASAISPTGQRVNSLSWINDNNVIITAIRSDTGNAVHNGATLPTNTTVVLTATPLPGYVFYEWVVPQSMRPPTENVWTLVLGSDVSGIQARAIPGQYTVAWVNTSYVTVTTTVDGVQITNGATVDGGKLITMTPTISGKYWVYEWENAPTKSHFDEDTGVLTFTLVGNVSGIRPRVR